MCIETYGMLVWQVADGYFHSIHFHKHVVVQVNITTSAGKKKHLFCDLEGEYNSLTFFIKDTHMSAILTLMCFCSA